LAWLIIDRGINVTSKNTVVEMAYKNSTKGTHIFTADIGDDGMPPKIVSLYVAKWALGKRPPKSITVTVVPTGDAVDEVLK
jgi:hypothetical protein